VDRANPPGVGRPGCAAGVEECLVMPPAARASRWHRVRRSETSRTDLWIWPSCAGVAGLVAGLTLGQVRPDPGTTLSRLAWPGDVDAASSLLQTVATSAITATTLTFTLTVVALQLASQQFSPRLLRNFMHDRVTKVVLSVLVATFLFAVTVLRGLRSDAPVPSLAMLVASVLAVGALGAVLGFITHITRLLRVDTMMREVHDEAEKAIAIFYPHYGDPAPRSPRELQVDESAGTTVAAASSGFVRLIDVDRLIGAAAVADAIARVEVRPGDHVVRGTPVATLWGRSTGSDLRTLEAEVHACLHLAYERTIEQDAAFGFRQLTDIAVKALSPGINDPVTAAHCIGHMADLLVLLTGRRLGPTLHEDEHGTGRAVVPDRDFRYYLDLVCGQIRRYGDREPTVLVALLRMLRDVAVAVRDPGQRAEVSRQVDLIVQEMPPSLPATDADSVRDLARRVAAALAGDTAAAYGDRAGETRSI